MNISELSQFIEARAAMLPTKFMLGGKSIEPQELASEHGFLPLIVLKINDLNKIILGARQSHSHYLESADEKTHILCSQVKCLPDIPDSAMKLYANAALLLLAREPLKELVLPFDINDELTLQQQCDLMAHIKDYPEDIIKMSPLAFPSTQSDGPTM